MDRITPREDEMQPARPYPQSLKDYHDAREQTVLDAHAIIESSIRLHSAQRVYAWVLDGLTPDAPYALGLVLQAFDQDRVLRWVRNMAFLTTGQELAYERPSDRCLADGRPLVNSLCVQCGRDNS